jgi:hypothetical protein
MLHRSSNTFSLLRRRFNTLTPSYANINSNQKGVHSYCPCSDPYFTLTISLNQTYRLKIRYRFRSQLYWLPWLANAFRAVRYLCQELATSALSANLSSAVANSTASVDVLAPPVISAAWSGQGLKRAWMMRQEYDSDVSGRSPRKVYLRGSEVVVTM